MTAPEREAEPTMDTPNVPKSKLRLNRPFNQNMIVGCILFCLPGIYLALTGLGAGGGKPSSQYVASKTNAILYGIFTIFGCLGGSVLNLIGPKLTFVIGAIGYPLYVGGLWYFDRTGNEWFPLFAGAMLGISAGFLWTACGFIQLAYAEESQKAMFITIQWAMTAFGGTVGSLIAFGINVNATDSSGVSTPVYAVFVTIMCLSIVIAFFCIVKPEDVVRDDGTHLAVFHATDARTEIKGILELFTDPKILLLLPGIFVAEVALAIMSSINGYFYNLRTRSLNNVMFEFVMIPFPLALAWIMDTKFVKKRRSRGLLGCTIIGVVTIGTYSSMAAFIHIYDIDRNATPPEVDWTDGRFAWGFILYLLCGIIYAGFQICGQWVLGALTNEPAKCARYAGLYKGITSLGLMTVFLMDGENVSYRIENIVQFVLYVVGLCSLFGVTWFCVKDTNYFLEADVIVPKHVEEEVMVHGMVEQQVSTDVQDKDVAKAVAA
ncbi:hypothetical protein LTR10_017814 [Elasticomyces elasticus]|uniref:Uncharacterized protein n=1 Tax=Exophiala sideris TaxID=1016849 RepID=A0ABR0J1I5_9EURO|nr:hypothetical protein LTR10_017814 [Elasticomyces elasticus]KAK5023813.1 hypothetical protein LTS07_008938 [Exophiala sideris]KAK5030168.1 hypothetical protein LTR13_008481 [Exophiala sideris]KAK5053663.1 hypothetical protein LTR69_009308 [Exophiala sideris]KAK5179294.1 hypothetical protein LTR44_008132 [Eurotiomycetes sp. CCFEE 6388]